MDDRTFREILGEKLGDNVADELIRRLQPSMERDAAIEELEEKLAKIIEEYMIESSKEEAEILAAPGIGAGIKAPGIGAGAKTAAKPTASGVGSILKPGIQTGVGTGVGTKVGTKKD